MRGFGGCPRTIRTYRQGLALLPPTLTKTTLAGWVVELRQRGVSPGGVNMYARTINSYLTWLHEEGQIGEHLRIKLLPKQPVAIIENRLPHALVFLCPACGNRWSPEEPGAPKH